MRIGIIGAGNMGGAIARGLAATAEVGADNICVSSHGQAKLDALTADCPGITTSTDNHLAILGTDVIILAVKPWKLDEVMAPLAGKINWKRQMLVSVLAGVTLEQLAAYAKGKPATIFRLIPNTAIAVKQSMTFVSALGASKEQLDAVVNLFNALGETLVVEEHQMAACTALSSCGIAYVMRYIRAATEGGVEVGIRASEAKDIMLQTMQGAVSLLKATGNHPEAEIDRVTTPGGITIKGLNAMEEAGFTASVIAGIKASNLKD